MASHALAVLAADHKAIGLLLAEFDELATDRADAEERDSLARQICDALTAHAVAEEDVFYPAAREALRDDDLIDDALAEHDSVRALVEQIETLDATDERFDALVIMLARAVAQHVRQEEGELFPRMEAAGLDMDKLGEQIIQRRNETLRLLAEESG
jgi:hemerythrin superfamily protein